jgi:deoxyribonuclease-4
MKNPILIGAHLSISGGIHQALYEAQSLKATVMQIFTANQKQWKTHLFTDDQITLWEKAKEETHISHIMSHDSYLINLGSSDEEILQKSKLSFIQEIVRCNQLKLDYLNFHPGSAVHATPEKCIQTICESLLSFEPYLENSNLTLLIENTAGQGSQVGYTFEQLGEIVHQVHHKIRIGICIDTCHAFSAGYDIRTYDGWENTLSSFNTHIGLSYLKAFHVNDSQKDLGSKVDRHASIGEGKIGLESFKVLMNHPHTKNLPKYLETPLSQKWESEIELLKSFVTTENL